MGQEEYWGCLHIAPLLSPSIVHEEERDDEMLQKYEGLIPIFKYEVQLS